MNVTVYEYVYEYETNQIIHKRCWVLVFHTETEYRMFLWAYSECWLGKW